MMRRTPITSAHDLAAASEPVAAASESELVGVSETWFYHLSLEPESPRYVAHIYWASVAALLIEEPVTLLRRFFGGDVS
jgi:hypothetical protein